MEYLICQHANDTVCCRRSQVGKLQFCCEVKQMRYFVLKYFDNIHGEKLKWKMRSTPAWRILGSFQKKLRIYCCQEWCEGIALFGRSEICSFHNLVWICFAACLKKKRIFDNETFLGGLILLKQKISLFLTEWSFLFYCGTIFIIFNLQNVSIHRSRSNLTIEVLKIAWGCIRYFRKIFFLSFLCLENILWVQ